MTISKNDVVHFVHPKGGNEEVGLVETRTAKTLKLLYQSEDKLFYFTTRSGLSPEQLVSMLKVEPAPAGTPLPSRLQEIKGVASAVPAKKDDVVAFVYEGVARTGRVLEGGMHPQVTLDDLHLVKLAATELKPAELPPTDKGLEGWSVLKYKVVPGHDDNEPFQAVIGYNGCPVIRASSDGWGGGNIYEPVNRAATADMDRFQDTISRFCERIDKKFPGSDDLWVHWDWYVRPTGLSFEKYLPEIPIRKS